MAQEVYRIEIPIEVDDKTAQALQQAGMRITKFEKSVERTEKQLQKVSRTKWQLTLHALDRASHVIRRIGSTARTVAGGTYRITVRVWDLATRPLRAISSLATSTLGLLGAGAGIAGGIIWPTKLADDLETARIGFETMLGSAKAADAFIAQIQEFAKNTPFGQAEVVNLAKSLLVRGFNQNEIIPMLERIGNVTAAMGTGAEGIDRIIYALGQMRALGRVSAEDMNQLTDAGVAAWRYLAEGMGMSIAEVRKLSEKGLLEADKAIKLILEGMKEFDGMMNQTANRTLRGLMSQILDVFEVNIFTRWGQGIQDAARPALSNIERWLSENEESINRWGDTLQRTARDATQWVINLFGNAFEYVRTRYLENPEFQNLDFQGKLQFIFADLYQAAMNWWTSTGQPGLEAWWKESGRPWFSETGKDAVWAIYEGIKEVAPIVMKIAGETIVRSLGPTILDFLGSTFERTFGVNLPGVGRTNEEILQEQLLIADDVSRSVRGYATGGIVTRPQLATVAETGPEAIIPLTNNRTRSVSLWQDTGRRLGVSAAGGKNIVVNLNMGGVVINNGTDEDAFMDRIAKTVEEVLGNMA